MSNSDEATVFVIDDDFSAQSSVCALLQTYQLRTEAFDSAEEFLRSYNGNARGCLLLDVQLKGMCGIDLLRKLREMGHNLPVILISGNADSHVAQLAEEHGAIATLTKPIDSLQLVEIIRSQL